MRTIAEVKWIKLATGLPDNKKIKQIRKLPEGDTIALLWVFLMCLAGETNDDGMVYFMPEIPYTDEMLADQFGMDVNTVRLGLATFQRFGMIEIVDDIIHLEAWEKWQSVDKLSEIREKNRQRVAKHREKKKALIAQEHCAYCGDVATGYDHILATARGGSDNDDNKVYCCAECNRIKNDKPLVDFLNCNRGRIVDNLVVNNPKLKRFVTLCNVTGHYTVTLGNAIDIDSDKEKEEESEKNKEIYTAVVSYLNEKAGTNYRASAENTKKLIRARLAEGYTLEDFKTVIDIKCAEWLNTDYAKYLRPNTLFQNSKFEQYLNQKGVSNDGRNQNGFGGRPPESDIAGRVGQWF